MPVVMVFDSMTIFLLFAVPISINNQQNEYDHASQKQNNDARLVSPQLGYETPEIQTHG